MLLFILERRYTFFSTYLWI